MTSLSVLAREGVFPILPSSFDLPTNSVFIAFLDDWDLFLSKSSLITDHASEVTHISTEMNARYLALQKQHQDFVNHWNSQITNLEQQLLLQSKPSCYEYHIHSNIHVQC